MKKVLILTGVNGFWLKDYVEGDAFDPTVAKLVEISEEDWRSYQDLMEQNQREQDWLVSLWVVK